MPEDETPSQPRRDQPTDLPSTSVDHERESSETDTFAQLFESMNTQRRLEEEEYRRQVTRSGYVDRLRDRFYELVASPVDFEAGMTVTWKEGLKNRRYPHYFAPAIVIALTPGFVDLSQQPPNPGYGQPADLELCVLNGQGQLLTFRADSRRFRLWRAEDLIDFTYPAEAGDDEPE